MQLKRLRDQVIVVFGASSGIGRETALRAARRGARVVAAARGEPGLRSLVQQIEAEGGTATAVTADATEFQQVKRVADHAAATFGRIDTWVHLAAVSIWARFEDTRPEEFSRVVATTLTGQAYGAMAALPHLRRSGSGALIHVGSGEGRRGLPYQSAYSAAKHGLKGMLDALRVELLRDRVPISVTEILPSSINTPIFEMARTRLGVRPQPVPPVYAPSVAAEAILYAAEHPIREVFIGGGAAALAASERMSPRLTDVAMALIADQQRSPEPSDLRAVDNMFASATGHGRVDGDYAGIVRGWSSWTWLTTHPPALPLAEAAIASLAVIGVARLLKR